MDNQKSLAEGNYDEKFNVILFCAVFVFTIGTYTIDTFISSIRIETIYLILTLFILLIYYAISNTRIAIYRIDIFWFIFFLYILFNMAFHGKFIKIYYIDMLAFGFIFVFLLLAKLNIRYIIISLKIMFVLSIVYALSMIFQYVNMDLYSRIILPRFANSEIEELMRIYRRGSFTGFTWQTAYISGYMIYGLGIVFFSYKDIKLKSIRIIMLLSIPLMFYSLFLAGKRAHLVFMIAALILTFLFSTEIKKFSIQLIKTGFILLIGVIVFVVLLSSYNPNPDSQFGKVFSRISETVEEISTGDDITSGRVYLYEYAIELFKEKPILGIGWRTYSEMSVGVINTDRGSHPHNIYIQLLTELGLIGLILFMIPVLFILFKTIKLLMNYNTYFRKNMLWRSLLRYSLYLQFFFLLYGLTGNLLTDRLFLFMYVFGISITTSAMYHMKKTGCD